MNNDVEARVAEKWTDPPVPPAQRMTWNCSSSRAAIAAQVSMVLTINTFIGVRIGNTDSKHYFKLEGIDNILMCFTRGHWGIDTIYLEQSL